MKPRHIISFYLLRLMRSGGLFFAVICAASPVRTQVDSEPSSIEKVIIEEQKVKPPAKSNRRVYPELYQPAAIKRRQLVIILPKKGCLSEPFDSLLFHGVSGDKFHLQKIPSCGYQVATLSARDLYGYQNFMLQAGGWSHPAEALSRWAEDESWIILGFAPLDENTIFVEAENSEGEYRTFHVNEIILLGS